MNFSIIITTYNRLELLKKAISSVNEQTVTDWELIIVNDCSSDGTKEYLDSLKNPKIKVIHNPVNLHKGGTRNVGIDNCSGKFVCFLDDDDYYLPHHLEVFQRKINEIGTQFGILFTQPINQNFNSNELVKRFLPEINNQNSVAYLFHHKNGVPTPRVCIPLNLLLENKFNDKIRIGQDTELFLRIAAQNPIYYLKEHTVVQVAHNDNSGALRYNAGLDRLNGYKYIFGNSIVSKQIPKDLKRYMISYCYIKMCNHYVFKGQKSNVVKSAFMALIYSPFDQFWKMKLVFILYNLPLLGNLFKLAFSKK